MSTTFKTQVSYEIMPVDETTTAQDVSDFFSGTDWRVTDENPENRDFICLYKNEPHQRHDRVLSPGRYLAKQGGRIFLFRDLDTLDASFPLSAALRKKLQKTTSSKRADKPVLA